MAGHRIPINICGSSAECVDGKSHKSPARPAVCCIFEEVAERGPETAPRYKAIKASVASRLRDLRHRTVSYLIGADVSP